MKSPASLRTKLALQQTSLFAILLFLLAWAAYGISSASMQREFDDRVFDRSAAIHSLMSDRDGSASWLDPHTDLEGSESLRHAFYQVLDAQGKVLAASGDLQLKAIPVTDAALTSLRSGLTTWESIPLPGRAQVRVMNRLVRDGLHNQAYVLRVGLSEEQTDERTRRNLLLLLLCIPLIVAIHAVIAWKSSGAAMAPVLRLTAAVTDTELAEPYRRIASPNRSNEFIQLTAALNRMIERLEGSSQSLREFLPNVSHEIRRPLANLRAESEFGLRHARTVEEYREVLAHQVATVDLITATISDMRQMAKCGSQPMKSKKQEQSISELVQATVDSMVPVASLKNIGLTASIPENIEGEIDTCQICRVLQNLIDNAIKYNREGGHVHVVVEQRNTSTNILISDTGIGIPAAEVPLIFERAYRSVKARASQIHGSGLGLYFTKMVVEAHQGIISVESVEGQGSSFRISLPGTRLVEAAKATA